MGKLGLFNKLIDLIDTSAPTVEKAEAPRSRELKEETFFATGVCYYLNNIKKLACKNEDWGKNLSSLKSEGKLQKRIYHYKYINKPVKLIPEPTNKHDKNAVQIVIAGELVGYIRAEEAPHIKHILSKCEVKYISAFISGGEYKVACEKSIDKVESEISVRIKIGYVGG